MQHKSHQSLGCCHIGRLKIGLEVKLLAFNSVLSYLIICSYYTILHTYTLHGGGLESTKGKRREHDCLKSHMACSVFKCLYSTLLLQDKLYLDESVRGCSSETVQSLRSYGWPYGNVHSLHLLSTLNLNTLVN